MKLKEALLRIWGNVEAVASVLDYDPLAEITRRVERLEHTIVDLAKAPEDAAK